jgi:hypothetical protein
MRALLVLLLLAAPARAIVVISPHEAISFERPESWAMNYYNSVTLFTGMGTPPDVRFGSLRLGLELGWIPRLSESERRVGFDGTKLENINQAPMFGRLRLLVGLPWKISVELGYVPPIELFEVRANLFAMAVERPILQVARFRLGVRAYGEVGEVSGSFTCSGPNDHDAGINCMAASNDQIHMRHVGLQLLLGYRFSAFEPYLGLAGNYLDNGFHVNAQYNGLVDHTELHSDGFSFATNFGLRLNLFNRVWLVGEGFYTPLVRRQDDHGLFNARGLLEVRAF